MRSLLIGAVTLVCAAACDRPTVTAVRTGSAAPASSSLLASALVDGFPLYRRNLLQQLTETFKAGSVHPRDSLTVIIDGHQEHFVATVITRVFEPTASMRGARPYVERTLIAWNHELDRGLVLSSEDSVAQVVYPDFATPAAEKIAHLWRHVAIVNLTDEQGRDPWAGTTGTLRMVDGALTGACPSPSEVLPKLKDACDRARYRVSLDAELEEATTTHAPTAFSRWFSHTQSIRIPEQELPGTRVLVRCPTRSAPFGVECDDFNFWRAPEQFSSRYAGQFSLDLLHLKGTTRPPFAFYQQMTPGAGPPIWCCSGYPGPVRYTLYAPDGAVLRTADLASARDDSLLRALFVNDPIIRYGSRTVLYYPRLGPYAPVVIDLTLATCPGVVDPNRWQEHIVATGPTAGCAK